MDHCRAEFCQFVSYAMSHLYCECQKNKHFSVSNIRFRRGSIIKSGYIDVVEVVSRHHQQSDNFCKIQKENTKWTWTVIYVWCFIVLLSSGAPCICVCSEGKRSISIAGLLPIESVHLVHSHQHPLPQRHWKKLNCWTRDYWLFSGMTEVVTTLAHFQNIPQPNWRHLTLSFCHYQCQQSTISLDILQGCINHGLLLGQLILCQHSTLSMKCWIGRCKLSMQHNTVDVNSAQSLRNETQSQALNVALQKKRMADICLFIAACQHIIAE